MTKRIAYVLLAVVLILGAGAVGYHMVRNGSAPGSSSLGEQAGAGSGPPRVLLNEVMFRPSTGQPQWVELINSGGESVNLEGLALVNHAGEGHDLPTRLTLPAGGILLIRFGGETRIDGLTIHANQPSFLHQETGSLTLTASTGPLDETYWSTADGPSFNLGRGGRIPRFVPGTSLGRARLSTERGAAAWTIFDPADTTPAAPNPFPAVAGMMPLSGAVLRVATPNLAWYGVPTARRYQVQVATDQSFASPVFDQVVETSGRGVSVERATTSTLSAGRYVWRVRAIFGDQPAESAGFSRPAIFWVEPQSNAASRGVPSDHFLSGLVAPLIAAQSLSKSVRVVLPVPLTLQGKDTQLLALEAPETGFMRWDAPWNPPEGPYCGPASVAMVTAFFGGKLSQDRLRYEAFKEFRPGPIFDIFTGRGVGDRDLDKMLTYALGSEPWLRFNETLTQQEYFDLHKEEIDKKVPVVATTDVHVFVVRGYGEDARGKYLVINDPAVGQYDWLVVLAPGVQPADVQNPSFDWPIFSTSFVLTKGARGRSDEPEVTKDSDGDGVMDLDEMERFGRFETNPHAKDTDGDGVDDKEEIRAWVYDMEYGWWRLHSDRSYGPFGEPGAIARAISDQDQDHKAMQVDEDSDGGGCFDGVEDLNRDGKHDPGQKELYNFNKDDDSCIVGNFTKIIDWVTPIDLSDGSRERGEHHEKQKTTFSLMPEADGTLRGRAIASYSSENIRIQSTRGNCRATTSMPPAVWGFDVTGRSRTLPDGSTEITLLSIPSQGPPVPVHSKDECPPTFSLTQTAPFPFSLPPGPYKLVNGRYRQGGEIPGAQQTAIGNWELTVELKRAQ